MNESVQRVKKHLEKQNVTGEVVHLPDHARTAKEAAEAIDCTVEQIAKSIIFKGQESDTPLLVIASGVNHINEQLLSELVGEPVQMATPDEVRHFTGFVIGGVAPIAHTKRLRIFIDEDLLQYESIWAAAGHPKTVFHLTPSELQVMTKGEVIAVQ